MKHTVLFLIDVLNELGGAEKNVFQLATWINPDKYKIIVCCLKAGKVYEEFKGKNIHVINLDIKRIYGIDVFRKATKLIKLIKKENVRVMVTYLESSDFWGSIVAKLAGVPVVISSRRDMGFNLKKRHILAYGIINHLFDRIISVCDAVKENIVKNEKTNPDKIVTIYNGVDIYETNGINKEETRRSLGLAPFKYTVTMLANLSPIKGHKNFLLAASEIIRKNNDIEFLLVGTGENGYKNELENLTCQLNIKNNVIFAGFRQDIAAVLSVSDVSVLSSTSEGFSNTILESMAIAKPVIATCVGGNPEAVVNGRTGLLVSPDDHTDLSRAILYLYDNRDIAQRMGKEGRDRMERFFSTQRMIEDIETLFSVLLHQKAHTRKFKTLRKILKRFAKALIANTLYYSGIIYLLDEIKHHQQVRILAYHKVSDEDSSLCLSCRVSSFRKQMQYLKRKYNIISLEHAVDLLQKKAKIPRRAIVVTFDDGSKDTYYNAFRLLEELNIPTTVFLTVNPLEKKDPIWFEAIIDIIHKTSRNTLNLESCGFGRYLINTANEKNEAINAIVSQAKELGKDKIQNLLTVLSRKLWVDFDAEGATSDNLTWKQINEMKEGGLSFAFGAHSLSHIILTNIPLIEAEYEICASRELIEKNIGEPVSCFAYPNGMPEDFNTEIIGMLKNNRFTCACTLICGSNNISSDLFSLKRINIHEGALMGISGKFSTAIFVSRISRFM